MILIEGGLVLHPHDLVAEPRDIVIAGETIADVVPPRSVTSEDVQRFDASDRLVIPGLVNGHHHAQAQLVKGKFDAISLELLLNGQRASIGQRTLEDKYLSALIGAAELVRKGCTASYDMFAELPLPTPEGVEAVARAYSDVRARMGMPELPFSRILTRRNNESALPMRAKRS